MRIERVALEHHRDVTLARLEVVDAPAADQDVARRDRFQSRDHPQQRRLATAGRTDQHDEFPVGDVEVDALHDDDVAEALVDIANADGRHGLDPSLAHRSRVPRAAPAMADVSLRSCGFVTRERLPDAGPALVLVEDVLDFLRREVQCLARG